MLLSKQEYLGIADQLEEWLKTNCSFMAEIYAWTTANSVRWSANNFKNLSLENFLVSIYKSLGETFLETYERNDYELFFKNFCEKLKTLYPGDVAQEISNLFEQKSFQLSLSLGKIFAESSAKERTRSHYSGDPTITASHGKYSM